ncbi:MAG: hypothetical protein ACYC8T_24330 [Myxococcaceae bacterium]
MNFVYMAHSGLRYLVLLAGLLAAVYFISGAAGRKPVTRAGRIFGSAFAGLLDLQIVLGLTLVAMGTYYPALIGHMVMMVMAAVLVHVVLVVNRRRPHPGHLLPLIGAVVGLFLIAGGIMAIGRPLLGSAAL